MIQAHHTSTRESLARGSEPVIIVVAPAGFGKTTLIRTWRADATESAAAGSFDAFYRTNSLDTGLVLTGVSRDLGVAAPVLKEALALVHPDGEALGTEFIRLLGDALRAVPHPFICFLDDLHVLSDGISREVGRLISSVADEEHRFVVASRKAPPWPTPRWRVTGFADTVEADQLRLTGAQITALLGPDLAHHAPRVLEVTGGWAAAVEAVRWRLKVVPTLVVADVARDFVDYVIAEVLPVLPPAEIRTLCRSSILQTFPASVAAAVAEDRAAARVLDEIRQHTSLVTKFEDGTYRYHPILQEALRQQLVRSEPERVPELHARAADAWLDEPDSFIALTNAVDHLIEARAWTQVVEQLKRRVRELDLHCRLDLLVHWLDAVPAREWNDDAIMVVMYGWASLRIGKANRAVEVLRTPGISANPAVAAVAALLQVAAVYWDADPGDAVELCEQVLPVLQALDAAAPEGAAGFPGVEGYELASRALIAMAFCFLGRFADAVVALDDALRLRHRFDPVMLYGLLGTRAFAHAMRGDIAAAKADAHESLQLAADTGAAARHELTAPATAALAVAGVSAGDAPGARELAREAATRCQPVRTAHMLQACDLVGSMCGIPDSFLAEVEPPMTTPSLSLVRQFTVPAAARGLVRLGDVAGAQHLLGTVEPNELTLSAWVEVLLATVERRRVRRWVATRPSPTCLRGRLVRLLVEAATAETSGESRKLVRKSAELATPEGLVGVILDSPVQLWARLDLEHESHPILVEVARQRSGPETNTTHPSLTSRELEVLRLLPYVSTANEIAARLFISVNTAKWHRANIYRKLGVSRREDAVAGAIDLGLIPVH